MAEVTTAAHVEQETEEENARDTLCSLFLKDFIAVTVAPSALVDVNWRCHHCAKTAAYHLRRLQKEQQLKLSSLPVGHIAVFGKLHWSLPQGWVFAVWHTREDVVIQLVLHSSPNPFVKGVCGNGIASQSTLSLDPVWLEFVKQFFGLMSWCHNQGRYHRPLIKTASKVV